MFLKDGIAYANEKIDEIKILDVKVVNELSLLVTFSSGEERIFDMVYLMQYEVYKRLKNYEVFKTVRVENGILVWENGDIDISPEEVYNNSYEYEKNIAK